MREHKSRVPSTRRPTFLVCVGHFNVHVAFPFVGFVHHLRRTWTTATSASFDGEETPWMVPVPSHRAEMGTAPRSIGID